MNSIAHATGAPASPTEARVTHIEEGRADHDHGYFFRMPDWLADALCEHHASGAAWALVTLVGRKTRWGACAPQRVTLQEMIDTTQYARQSLVDAVAVLINCGVLYKEQEPKGKWVRYALIDRTTCTGPYAGEDGRQVIDLLHLPAYSLPEHGLKSRPREESLYRSKKQTRDGLKCRPLWSKIQTRDGLKCRPREAAEVAPEQAPKAALDYVDKRDTKDPLILCRISDSQQADTSPRQPALFPAVDTGNRAELPPHPEKTPGGDAPPSVPRKARKPDLLWDKAVELFGHAPRGGEVWQWRKAMKQLRGDAITPELLEVAAQRYRREHPTWHYSFKAVFDHLGELLPSTWPPPGRPVAAPYQYAPAIPAYLQPRKEVP